MIVSQTAPPLASSSRRPSLVSAPLIVLFGVVGFVVLTLAAMLAYPGGNVWDLTASGNDFWLNYLCDLERRIAIDGQPNLLGSLLTQGAMLMLALGMTAFWLTLPTLFPSLPRLGRATRALGVIAAAGMAAAALLPGDRFEAAHPLIMAGAGVPGIVAAWLATIGLARARIVPATVALLGAATAGTSAVDLGLYLAYLGSPGPGPQALAVLERASFLLGLAWMWGVTKHQEVT